VTAIIGRAYVDAAVKSSPMDEGLPLARSTYDETTSGFDEGKPKQPGQESFRAERARGVFLCSHGAVTSQLDSRFFGDPDYSLVPSSSQILSPGQYEFLKVFTPEKRTRSDLQGTIRARHAFRGRDGGGSASRYAASGD